MIARGGFRVALETSSEPPAFVKVLTNASSLLVLSTSNRFAPTSRVLVVVVGLAWLLLLPGCGREGTASLAIDAGGTPGGGALFSFDAAVHVCRESGAVAIDAGIRDASTCQPSRHVSYLDDVVPVFGKNCSGEVCHSGSWGGSGAYQGLVDVAARECCDGRKLVRPGDPTGSYVIQKLRGIDLCDGGRMPLGRTIDERDVATIEDWICEGAPNL
jgi:hypothetical protein